MTKSTSMRNKAYTETEELFLRACAKLALERNLSNTEIARCISPLLDRTPKGIEVKISLFRQEFLQKETSEDTIKSFAPRPRLEPLTLTDVGKRVKAKVYAIKPYGAFCETEEGKTGLIIKSLLTTEFVEHIEDYLQAGDVFEALVVADKANPGKILLNAKALGDIISIQERTSN